MNECVIGVICRIHCSISLVVSFMLRLSYFLPPIICTLAQGHTDGDDYLFDESVSVAEVDNSFDLMLLDLSNNKYVFFMW